MSENKKGELEEFLIIFGHCKEQLYVIVEIRFL